MEKRLPYDHFLIFLGTFSVFACFMAAFPTAFSFPLFLLLAMPLYCFIQWIVMKRNGTLLLVFFAMFFIILFLFRSSLIDGFQYLYNQMVEVYTNNDHYVFNVYELTEDGNHLFYATFCILAVFICYVLVLSVTIQNHAWYGLDFILSLSLFVPTIMYRIPQLFLLDAMLFSFWILLFISGTLIKHDVLSKINKQSFQRMTGLVFAISFALLCIFPQFLYKENQWVEHTRLQVQKLYQNITHHMIAQMEGEVDLRNAQDRYYLNIEQMKVKASSIKEYYIKTFTGAIYEDQKWKMLGNNYYEGQEIDWENSFLWYKNTHEINHNASRETMEIEDERSDDRYALLPYDLAQIPKDYELQYDAFATTKRHTITYELLDMENLKDQKQNKFDRNYDYFVKTRYLNVPSQISSLFHRLRFAYPSKKYTVDEAASVIKSYLDHETSYTLKPGATPIDQDFITYFLTENKKGYCVHYASTATLMFRYLGLPARYVEGYHVSKSSFQDQGTASVLDKDAHAWVEVFDEEQGWLPIEVTPSSTSASTSTTQNNPNQENPNEGTVNNKPQEQQQSQNQEGSNQTTEPKETKTEQFDLPVEFLIPIAIPVVALFFMFWIHKRRYQKWMHNMTQKDRKQALKECSSYLTQWSLYGVDIDESDHRILDKAIYSQHTMDEAEYQQVYTHLIQQIQTCYQQLSIKEKLYVVFWKAIK